MGEVKVEGGYVVYGITILVQKAPFFLELSDHSQKMRHGGIRQNFILFVHHLLHIASVKAEGLLKNGVCLIDDSFVKFWQIRIDCEILDVVWQVLGVGCGEQLGQLLDLVFQMELLSLSQESSLFSGVECVSHFVVLTYDNTPFFSEKAVTLRNDQVHTLPGLLFR